MYETYIGVEYNPIYDQLNLKISQQWTFNCVPFVHMKQKEAADWHDTGI